MRYASHEDSLHIYQNFVRKMISLYIVYCWNWFQIENILILFNSNIDRKKYKRNEKDNYLLFSFCYKRRQNVK